MKLKHNTYYKRYYGNNSTFYDIWYIDNDGLIVYILGLRNKKYEWGTIKRYQEFINDYNYKIEEISKEDLFLELL